MPVPDFETYKVAAGELSSATKFDGFVQAVEDEFADIDADQIAGYPASVAKFLRGDGAWAGDYTTYTPVWSALGTAVSLGNGTIAGRYLQVGKTVFFTIKLVFGSTTTFGTGTYKLTLPALTPLDFEIIGGSGVGFDTGTQLYPLHIGPFDSTAFTLLNGSATNVTNTTPFTWGSGDKIVVSGWYEVA